MRILNSWRVASAIGIFAFQFMACGGDKSAKSVSESDAAVPTDSSPSEAGSDAGDAGASSDSGSESRDQPFRVYREFQERLRQSPDHRMARAQALIESRDAARIFAFVRDEIRAVPVLRLRQRFQPFEQRMLFGARGTLWGGIGTPRDKVELLKWLLAEAGFTSHVKVAFADARHRDTALLFRKTSIPSFTPAITDADLSRWSEWFGAELRMREHEVTDPDGTMANAVAEQLLSLVSSESSLTVLPDLSSSRIPLLEVELATGKSFANPLFGDLELGQSGTSNLITDAAESETTTTSVRVFARHSGYEDPNGETLVEGTWSDAELVGRRLVFRMRPNMSLSEVFSTRVDQLQSFLPSLSLEGWELPEAEGAAALRVGAVVTLSGDFVSKAADGRVQVNHERWQSAEGEAERFSAIQRLELSADASHFPTVRLNLRPLLENGELVPGLRGEHFVLDEDEVAVAATWRSNQVVPRVLFVIDRSTSVPAEFRGEALKTLCLDIASTVFAHPDGEAAMMFIGETRSTYQPFTRDASALAAQFDRSAGGGSRLYSALGDAVRRKPSLVVMISDGVVVGETRSDAMVDEIRRAGIPAVVLGVGTQQVDVLTDLATVSSGTYVGVADAGAARTAVVDFLSSDTQPYEVVYRAPRQGAERRTLTMTTRDGRITAQVVYDVPATPHPSGGFAGIYLTVTRDGESVIRTLAGLPLDVPLSELTEDTVAQVEASFLGSSSLIIEGGTPGWSQIVDQQLTSMLSLEPMWDARDNENLFRQRLDEGFSSLPFAALRQMFGAHTAEADATPLGPRFVLYTERPAPEVGDSERRVDMLPLSRSGGVSSVQSDAFRATLRSTVADAVLESEYFTNSTINALANENLSAIAAETLATHFAGLPNLAAWQRSAQAFDDEWTLLVPTDGLPVAFWAVHEATGTALAILEGGGGAGTTAGAGGRAEQAVSAAETLAYLYSLTGLSGGVWLNLEVAKAKQIAYATMSIASMGSGIGGGPPPSLSPQSTIEGFICGEAENAVLDALPAAIKHAIATYNRIASAQGHPKLCP